MNPWNGNAWQCCWITSGIHMDTKHYHFTRYKKFKISTTSTKPDLKPSGHNSSFPFLSSCLPQQCLSSPSSVFTLVNFKMYFYYPCVSQVSELPFSKWIISLLLLDYSEKQMHINYSMPSKLQQLVTAVPKSVFADSGNVWILYCNLLSASE